jgi:hypothetical protein
MTKPSRRTMAKEKLQSLGGAFKFPDFGITLCRIQLLFHFHKSLDRLWHSRKLLYRNIIDR